MAMSKEEKKINEQIKKIIEQTVTDMKATGIYRSEFDSTIKSYSQMRQQYDTLMKEFYSTGCKITEEYTNKASATNIRKTALYLAIETLRKDIVNHENILGLTPLALKKIVKNTGNNNKKGSKLGEALKALDG